MILVADLVRPGPKTPARQDVLVLEIWQDFGQRTVAVHVRRRVAVVEATHVGAHNLVLGPHQIRRQRTLDSIGEERLVVDGLVLRLGHLEHERPVGTRFRV